MNKLRLLYFCAVLCFVPTLFFYYVGEEGVYTISSMEMWQRHEFVSAMTYGSVYWRPPMFNWLMIPLSSLVGWGNVLVASRIVTISATIGSSLIAGWLAWQLWRDRDMAQMAAVLYLVTADVILYRGWLSYADPLFSMFVFLAIALAWAACLRTSHLLLAAAMLAAFAAFLTKALTSYVFLGTGLLVLLGETGNRRFLLNPKAWIIYAGGLLLPFAWYKFGTPDVTQSHQMLNDILGKLNAHSIKDYLARLAGYPLELFVRLMPSSLFVGYFLLRRRDSGIVPHPAVRTCLLIALLSYLPYWLAPEGGVRYVLPVYPFVALAAAYLVVRQPERYKARRWILGMIIFSLAMTTLAYPYYQRTVRGENYLRMAREILDDYGQYPLYATDVSSVGLSVVANIDSMRFDRPALTFPPADFTDGIVIAYTPDDIPGHVLKTLGRNGDKVYLICRGTACAAGG